VGLDSQANVLTEIAKLRAAIGRDAGAAEVALAPACAEAEDDGRSRRLPQHQELSRQLAALRERVARAGSELSDHRAVRAELATLAHFSRTLREDADAWRSRLHQALCDLAQQEAAARQERDRLAAERDRLLRDRDLLQAKIDRTAAEMAQDSGGECRRTVPVIRLDDAVTVCSMTVSRPRKLFRAMRLWLVTLSSDRDQVLVRPD
jgi:chromosome segregation ATPase